LYTGAWWETVVHGADFNKGGGELDLKLSDTQGTTGAVELTATDRHSPQTFTGTWYLTGKTNLIKIVVTNAPGPKWIATLNRSKQQVSGTWSRLRINRGKFQAVRWYGLAE
jgi:hypothetical protein